MRSKNASLALISMEMRKQYDSKTANNPFYSAHCTSGYVAPLAHTWGSPCQNAFMALPEGCSLLSPCNWVLRGRPPLVYLHQNRVLLEAITDIHFILRTFTSRPTRCRNLVTAWPDFVGVVDASSFGVGGIIIGEHAKCPPTVFRLQWPAEITSDVVSFTNPMGRLTSSDLEMAGLLLLWLCIEGVCSPLSDRHVALFSDNPQQSAGSNEW